MATLKLGLATKMKRSNATKMPNNFSNTNAIKLALTGLLLGCLLPMPYGYFQLVRFLALFGFGFLALEASKRNSETEMYIFIALAVMFQPFFKISFGRFLWNIIDVIVAAGLVLSLVKPQEKG